MWVEAPVDVNGLAPAMIAGGVGSRNLSTIKPTTLVGLKYVTAPGTVVKNDVK
jgi:hypothetical protein